MAPIQTKEQLCRAIVQLEQKQQQEELELRQEVAATVAYFHPQNLLKRMFEGVVEAPSISGELADTLITSVVGLITRFWIDKEGRSRLARIGAVVASTLATMLITRYGATLRQMATEVIHTILAFFRREKGGKDDEAGQKSGRT